MCCCSVAPTQDVVMAMGEDGHRAGAAPQTGVTAEGGPAQVSCSAAKPEDFPNLLNRLERGDS